MKKIFYKSLFTFFIIFSCSFLLSSAKFVSAAATHLVISQVQVGGSSGNGGAGNEFVELYNPTNSTIDITGWRLRVENSTGTSFSNLVSSMSGSIAAHHYYLVGSPAYNGSAVVDAPYSASSSAIPANGTILLYSDASVTLVDKVGMGTATDFETTAAPLPANDGSIQRKLDDTSAHGLDTDNNLSDFEVLVISTPRNSTTVVATPTASPTASPTPTSTPTSSPTGSPTATPSPTPTATSTPTSTPTPTSTSTSSPTPTVTPTATPTPTSTPTGGPVIGIFNFPDVKIVCRVNYKFVHHHWFFGFFPQIICSRV